jgi:hypothetical protein
MVYKWLNMTPTSNPNPIPPATFLGRKLVHIAPGVCDQLLEVANYNGRALKMELEFAALHWTLMTQDERTLAIQRIRGKPR